MSVPKNLSKLSDEEVIDLWNQHAKVALQVKEDHARLTTEYNTRATRNQALSRLSEGERTVLGLDGIVSSEKVEGL